MLIIHSLQGYKELNSPYDACVVASADLTLLECLEVPQLYLQVVGRGGGGVWDTLGEERGRGGLVI